MTYTAHATMTNGLARVVTVEAPDAVEARRRMFALDRAIASLTNPRPLACATVLAALAACGGGDAEPAPVNVDATVMPVSCSSSGACA